jgi:hypothetical protein
MILRSTPKTVNDFKQLFNLVCARHQGPVIAGFGRQMYWDGIVAAEYNSHILSIQADGISAMYDDRLDRLQFSEGTPALLHALLAARQGEQATA